MVIKDCGGFCTRERESKMDRTKNTTGCKLRDCIFELRNILADLNVVVENTCENQFPEDSLDRNETLLLISHENIEKLINWLENN